jgi:hypothetical protein
MQMFLVSLFAASIRRTQRLFGNGFADRMIVSARTSHCIIRTNTVF